MGTGEPLVYRYTHRVSHQEVWLRGRCRNHLGIGHISIMNLVSEHFPAIQTIIHLSCNSQHLFSSSWIFFFLVLPIYIFKTGILPRYKVATSADLGVCSVYFIGAAIRFLLSATYIYTPLERIRNFTSEAAQVWHDHEPKSKNRQTRYAAWLSRSYLAHVGGYCALDILRILLRQEITMGILVSGMINSKLITS